MNFDGKGKRKKLIFILVALIVIILNAVVIMVCIQEKMPGLSFLPDSERCIDLPSSPDQYYSIFSPVHMLMKNDEQFKDVPMNMIPGVYDPIIPVKYNFSDDSFSIGEIFEDKYSFDYYPDATKENMTINYTPDLTIGNLTVTYSPDVKLDGNILSFDILIVNRGNEDIEISNVSVKNTIHQVNGQCNYEQKFVSDYAPDVLIHPLEYSEIRLEINLLSPGDVENLGLCKYFNQNIRYQEDNLISVTKRGSPYSYGTKMRFEIESLY